MNSDQKVASQSTFLILPILQVREFAVALPNLEALKLNEYFHNKTPKFSQSIVRVMGTLRCCILLRSADI